MKTRKNLIFLILLALLTAGCEEVMEFDIDEGSRAVVVNALPCADSTLFVNITYSRFFLDNTPFQPVVGADVSMDGLGR